MLVAADTIRLARRYWYVVAVVALMAAFAVISFRQASESSPLVPVGKSATGSLEVAGIEYPFEPETCFVGNGTFVASGTGSMDGVDYRVSSSPSVVEIVFGTSEEAATPPPGSRWLTTIAVISWKESGTAVAADVQLFERDTPLGPSSFGSLRLNCTLN